MHRRTVLASLSGALAGGIAGCLTSPRRDTNSYGSPDSVAPGTWPQVGYDSQNTRANPHARGPRDGARIAWRELGDRPVYPPVVAGDSLYLTEAWTGGRAVALTTSDGAARWTNPGLPTMRWAPALHEDRVLVLSRESGNVVRLHALNTATGDQEWVRNDGITASSSERPPSSPTVRGDAVYLASNRGVIACQAATGDIDWSVTLGPHVVETSDGPTWRTDWAKPAVTAHRVFTFDMNENYQATREVYAVDRQTGDRDWTVDLTVGDGWYLTGQIVAGGDLVFVSALKPHVAIPTEETPWSGSQRLFALDAASGTVQWDWTLSGKSLSQPAYADGTLYVGEWHPAADTGRLHALDATEGSSSWTYTTETGLVGSPTVAGDTVFISQGEELAGISTADGERRWRLPLGARTGAPIVVGDSLYVHTAPGHDDDSQLIALREP